MKTNFPELLRTLSQSEVDFIVVGGAAATAHGSAMITYDLDIVYSRTPENIQKIVTALAPYQPYLRGAPLGLPTNGLVSEEPELTRRDCSAIVLSRAPSVAGNWNVRLSKCTVNPVGEGQRNVSSPQR